MSDDKKRATSGGAASALLVAGTVAAMTYATDAHPSAVSAALAAAGSGGLGAFVDSVFGFIRGEVDTDLEVWWTNVWKTFDGADDVRESVQNRITQPKAQRVLVESLRAIANRI